MIKAEVVFEEIKKNGVTHVVGIPDNGSRVLYQKLRADPGSHVVSVTREGEAFALAAGLCLGGKKPMVLIQNTGFFESGDAFRGTALNMAIPLVMLIGYRGYKTMAGIGALDTAAVFFEPILKAWNVPYYAMRSSSDSRLISEAFSKSGATSLPVAVIYPGEMI
jgi:sulfopyruvate decarboxylase TPP-binding subunit